MKKIIVSLFVLSFFLFVGCGEEQANGDKERHDEPIAYKGDAKIWNFDNDKQGGIASGFSIQVTGNDGPGKWEVIKDDTAPSMSNVIAQTSLEHFGHHFGMAVNEKAIYDDLELTVKFKGVEGKEDQGGGPVWRYQDNNNYYIARANPLENNYRVYKVVDGKRIQMDSARLNVTSDEWHTIRILARKNKIQCFYEGQLYLEVTDDTFLNKGKIGLWTKADAVTYFDDLEVRPIVRHSRD
ncbi:MAG: DUF1080 domain-containing protein [Candidatus Scalindua sp.]|nr:DUF1080 domain-containing protein [Candidatus Scalindua sp.]